MTVALIFVALLIILIIYIIAIYNGLVRKKSEMEEGWSSIDVFLKKRYDLIPNLLETVKGYATHERELLQHVTHARNMAQKAQTVKEQSKAETRLEHAMLKVMAVAENYPNLKANENFRYLQNELVSIEDDIEMARRYYNSTVKRNNIAIESFPNNIIANQFNFKKGDFFEIENQMQREPVNMKF